MHKIKLNKETFLNTWENIKNHDHFYHITAVSMTFIGFSFQSNRARRSILVGATFMGYKAYEKEINSMLSQLSSFNYTRTNLLRLAKSAVKSDQFPLTMLAATSFLAFTIQRLSIPFFMCAAYFGYRTYETLKTHHTQSTANTENILNISPTGNSDKKLTELESKVAEPKKTFNPNKPATAAPSSENADLINTLKQDVQAIQDELSKLTQKSNHQSSEINDESKSQQNDHTDIKEMLNRLSKLEESFNLIKNTQNTDNSKKESNANDNATLKSQMEHLQNELKQWKQQLQQQFLQVDTNIKENKAELADLLESTSMLENCLIDLNCELTDKPTPDKITEKTAYLLDATKDIPKLLGALTKAENKKASAKQLQQLADKTNNAIASMQDSIQASKELNNTLLIDLYCALTNQEKPKNLDKPLEKNLYLYLIRENLPNILRQLKTIIEGTASSEQLKDIVDHMNTQSKSINTSFQNSQTATSDNIQKIVNQMNNKFQEVQNAIQLLQDAINNKADLDQVNQILDNLQDKISNIDTNLKSLTTG